MDEWNLAEDIIDDWIEEKDKGETNE